MVVGANFAAFFGPIFRRLMYQRHSHVQRSYAMPRRTHVHSATISKHQETYPRMISTALDQAVWRQHPRVVKFLLPQKGIRVHVVNGDGQTPLMIARQKGDPVIVRMLEEAGVTTRDARSPLLSHR